MKNTLFNELDGNAFLPFLWTMFKPTFTPYLCILFYTILYYSSNLSSYQIILYSVALSLAYQAFQQEGNYEEGNRWLLVIWELISQFNRMTNRYVLLLSFSLFMSCRFPLSPYSPMSPQSSLNAFSLRCPIYHPISSLMHQFQLLSTPTVCSSPRQAGIQTIRSPYSVT